MLKFKISFSVEFYPLLITKFLPISCHRNCFNVRQCKISLTKAMNINSDAMCTGIKCTSIKIDPSSNQSSSSKSCTIKIVQDLPLVDTNITALPCFYTKLCLQI